MVISIERGNHVEFPERCPCMHREKHHLFVCGHPTIDIGRTSLYCNYCNTPDEFIEPPSRCPMKKHPVDGVSIRMRK